MKVVIDANIIFSALLSKNSRFREILSNLNIEFFAPQILIDEINKNIDKIFLYSKVAPKDIEKYLKKLTNKITFIEMESIPVDIYKKAFDLCIDYDEEDTPYVAISLYLDSYLWTGDKIKTHLKKKGFDKIFNY